MYKTLTIFSSLLFIITTGCSNKNPSHTDLLKAQKLNTNTLDDNSIETLNDKDRNMIQKYDFKETGLSFVYFNNWGKPLTQQREAGEYQVGRIINVSFPHPSEPQISLQPPQLRLQTNDYQMLGPTDGYDFNFNNLDLKKSLVDLKSKLTRPNGMILKIERIETPFLGLMIHEKYHNQLDGQNYFSDLYIFPLFDKKRLWNLVIITRHNDQNHEELINSLSIEK